MDPEIKNDLSQYRPLLKRIVTFVVSPFLFLFLLYYFFLSAPNDFPKGIIVDITQGSSLRSISLDLKTKHIIRSRLAFETFVILYGGERHIAFGDYLFEDKTAVFEIARRIAVKDRHLAPIKITIPEGFDLVQIAEISAQKLSVFDKEKFLVQTKGKEGYLFPDTYFFFTNANEQDVIKYMEDNFDRKIKSVLALIDAGERTEKEIITMASLIEREAKGDNDRGLIAGILWNRINKNMPLQIDAVPETYKVKGLPESPICNPGLDAIRAAIHPIASPYFYYLHDKDGVIHYARTFAEHKQNIMKYLK